MKAERLAEIRAWVEEQKAFDLPLEPYGLASPWHEQAYAIIDDLLAEIVRLTTIDDAMVESVAILLWARNEEWWLQQTESYREAGRGSARGVVEAVLRPAE